MTVAESRRTNGVRLMAAASEERIRGVPVPPRAASAEARLTHPLVLAASSLLAAGLVPPSTTHEFEGGAVRSGAALRPPLGGSAGAPTG